MAAGTYKMVVMSCEKTFLWYILMLEMQDCLAVFMCNLKGEMVAMSCEHIPLVYIYASDV